MPLTFAWLLPPLSALFGENPERSVAFLISAMDCTPNTFQSFSSFALLFGGGAA